MFKHIRVHLFNTPYLLLKSGLGGVEGTGGVRAISVVMAIFILIVFPAIVMAGAVDLPQTGQTISYASGDDGDLENGVAWPIPRFTDNGNGTVTDNLTGLMWTQGGNAPGPATCSPGTMKTWQGALDYVACLNTNSYIGYTDWRLPNVNELNSLVNAGQPNMATWLNAQGFSNVQTNFYWSSTSTTSLTSAAFAVNMYDGGVFHGFKTNSYFGPSLYYVWPVRGGQGGTINLPKTGQTACYNATGGEIPCTNTGQDGDIRAGVEWPDPRFIIGTEAEADCITDNLTGLMWLRNPNSTTRTWQEALTSANELTLCGYSDWHLPNVNELESLINAGQSNTVTWLNGQGFNAPSGWYWLSTTSAKNASNAWVVHMMYGFMFRDNEKTYYGNYPVCCVWPVRSVQVVPLGHSIIEQVTENSTGLGGVTMTLSGDASATTTTASDGTYSFTGLADGNYTVTPAIDGYTFSPTSIDVSVAGADVTSVDFMAYPLDTTPPTGSIIINNNALWTKTTTVTLTLDCADSETGCADMRFSNDNVNFTDWEGFSTSKPWMLPSGDGEKWVYVQYRDGAGNGSGSLSDNINLDTTKPVVKGVSDSPDPFKHHLGEKTTISFTLSDNLSWTCTIQVKIYNTVNELVRTIKKKGISCPAGGEARSLKWDGKDTNGNLVPVGTYTYKIQARDNATNKSAIKQGTVGVE